MADVIYHPGNSNLSGPGIGISGTGPSNGGTTPNNGSSVIRPGSNGSSGRYEQDEVILNPAAPVMPNMDYSQINSMFEKILESFGGFGSSAEDYKDVMSDMFDEYKQYNDQMWNRAKEYDEYMSNTAIQRQVEDLIKAGLNPILASHLGGASFNGVTPSYASINPSQAFSALAGLEGTKYSANASRATQLDVMKMRTSADEFLSSYNRSTQALLQNDRYTLESQMTILQRDVNAYLENIKHLHNRDLAEFGFHNQEDLENYKQNLNFQFDEARVSKDSTQGVLHRFEKIMDFVGKLVPGVITAIGVSFG